jgi:hypothetical protein
LKHLRLRCGQQQLTPGDSGLLTPLHQRRRESLTQRLNARTSMKTTLNTHHCLPWGPDRATRGQDRRERTVAGPTGRSRSRRLRRNAPNCGWTSVRVICRGD